MLGAIAEPDSNADERFYTNPGLVPKSKPNAFFRKPFDRFMPAAFSRIDAKPAGK
jgi:hypothetical protein